MTKKQIAHLIKISTCMFFSEKKEDLPEFLAERWGKYYFNVDVNDDDDTKKNLAIKTEYLEREVR